MADEIVNADVVIGDVLNVTVDNVSETVTVTQTTSQEILNATIVPGTKGDKGDTGATGAAGADAPSDHTLLTNIGTNTHAQIDTAISNSVSHIANTSNPHGVTKAQVGLSNVPNTDFTAAVAANTAARHTHANKTLLDTYSQTEVNLADAVAKKHTHANSAVLDATTASFTTADETKLDGIAAGAQVNTVTSVNTRTGAVTGLAEASDVTTALAGKVDKTGDVMTGSLAATTFTAGTATDVLGTALSVIRNNVEVGRIDNNASGLRVQAQSGSLQLRGTGNTGIAIDASGNAVVAGNITGANLSGTNTGDQPLGSRTITGTTNQVTVTNGDGVSGNPTLSLPQSIATTSSPTFAGLTINGTTYSTGTGFPNGVVSAPVGSIYIDTAITNGASSWIKKSGTGNTGWIIDKGDTGWRDITALFGSQLSTTYNPNDYGVYIRRKDEVVTINFKCAIGTGYSGSSVGMPAGFKAGGSSSNTALPFSILNLWQTAGSNTGQVQISTTFSFVVFTNITAGTRYYGSLTYIANDAYPSTLPGTAA